MVIKGMAEPVDTYLVESARPREFRVTTRGVEGLETRMIGRRTELELLQATLYEVVRLKQMRLVTIVGEAGLGKSRLLYEFDNWLDLVPEEIVFFKGRADRQMRHSPFYLFRAVFAFRFQVLDNDPPETVRQKFEEGFAGFLGPDGVKRMTRLHAGLRAERRMNLGDAESVQGGDACERAARLGDHLRPDAVPRETRDRVRRPARHPAPPAGASSLLVGYG
jgi:hypothetical protein